MKRFNDPSLVPLFPGSLRSKNLRVKETYTPPTPKAKVVSKTKLVEFIDGDVSTVNDGTGKSIQDESKHTGRPEKKKVQTFCVRLDAYAQGRFCLVLFFEKPFEIVVQGRESLIRPR